MECKFLKMINKVTVPAILPVLITLFLLSSCAVNDKPQPVVQGKDVCSGCEMTIVDLKFAAEIITNKGRCLKFDDLSCMFHYISKMQEPEKTILKMYVADYLHKDTFLDIKKATLILGDSISSPMNGGVAAFSSPELVVEYAKSLKAEVLDTWERLRIQH